MTTERTPQDVLREALADVRSFVAEEPAREGAGLHFAISQVRVLDYIDTKLEALDKAIAEAPDSPPLTLRDFAPPRYRHEPDGMRFDPKGAYVLFHMTAAAVKEAAPDSRKPSAIAGVTGEAARILDAVVEAAPDTLSEKPGLDAIAVLDALEEAMADADKGDTWPGMIDSFRFVIKTEGVETLLSRRLGSTDSEGR